jgi:hypothetical protein
MSDRTEEALRLESDCVPFVPWPTKFPFAATVNGEPVTVWPDWIEREEVDA